MRIISGKWRGRPLVAPEGLATRPTSDRAREGLFSMLLSRIGSFEGLRVADLFAGSGALGLEALSRGAAHCLFLDSDRNAIEAIRRNAGRLGAVSQAEMKAQRVEQAPTPSLPFDLVFLDPPYKAGLAPAALEVLIKPGWLSPGALVSLESNEESILLPPSFEKEAERRFGKATILLLRSTA